MYLKHIYLFVRIKLRIAIAGNSGWTLLVMPMVTNRIIHVLPLSDHCVAIFVVIVCGRLMS